MWTDTPVGNPGIFVVVIGGSASPLEVRRLSVQLLGDRVGL